MLKHNYLFCIFFILILIVLATVFLYSNFNETLYNVQQNNNTIEVELVKKKIYESSEPATSHLKNVPEIIALEFNESNEIFITCKNKIKLFFPKRMEKKYDQKVIRRHPNLPQFFINASLLMNLIPPDYSILWSGSLYQESWKVHPNCKLYSANFDARMTTGPVARILGLCEEINLTLGFYCQFWYNETQNPVASSVYEMYFPGPFVGKNIEFKARMMSCKIPKDKDLKTPIAVSIVRKPCTHPTNILKIGGSLLHKNKEKTKETSDKNIRIGLCGKALFFYNKDYSLQLIEWVEIMKLLGISQFFLYRTLCHKNVEKVLDYYEKQGIATIIDFQFPNPSVQEGTFIRNWIHSHLANFRSAQRMFYNDCILKNKDSFDYLAVFDYDEIPILKIHKNLLELLDYIKKEVRGSDRAAAFGLGWKYLKVPGPGVREEKVSGRGVRKETSEDLHFLRHTLRTSFNENEKYERNEKSIYDTDKVLFIACHSLLKFNATSPLSVKTVSLNRNIAYTGHFKNETCDSECSRKSFYEDRLLEYEIPIREQIDKIRQEIDI